VVINACKEVPLSKQHLQQQGSLFSHQSAILLEGAFMQKQSIDLGGGDSKVMPDDAQYMT